MKIVERKNPDGSTTVGILSDTKEWEAPKEKPTKEKRSKNDKRRKDIHN